jgi:hypothetical protein
MISETPDCARTVPLPPGAKRGSLPPAVLGADQASIRDEVIATGVERALVFGAHPSRGERDDAQLTPARQSWAVGDAMPANYRSAS